MSQIIDSFERSAVSTAYRGRPAKGVRTGKRLTLVAGVMVATLATVLLGMLAGMW